MSRHHDYMDRQLAHEDAKHVAIRVHRDRGEISDMQIITPNQVVKVDDQSDLEKLLEHYGHHAVWQQLIPDNEFARRYYVEKIRPALRFYCAKYKVTVPDWLKSEDFFNNMEKTTMKRLFGTIKLHPIEFQDSTPKNSIKDHAEHHEGQEDEGGGEAPKPKPKGKPGAPK